MIGHAPTLAFSWGATDGSELFVAIVFACAAIVAVSMIAAVLGDNTCRSRVSAAARLAAQDAAREASPDRALRAAERAAADTLTGIDRIGRRMIVVDVSKFQSAGLVEVTVACTVAPRSIGPIDRALQLHQATASASIHPGLSPR